MATAALHQVRLAQVSCYLIASEGRAMLVDCGNAGSEKPILAALKNLHISPHDLELLVLTHAHFDHAGAAAAIREQTGCRIVVHRSEAGRVREGFTPLPSGTRWKARVLVGLGRIFARRLGTYPPAIPDILVDDELDLVPYGFPARLIHAPGHTRGSMVVLLESGELIAGDTFFGLEGKQHFPPFAEDLPALLDAWKSLRELEISTIYPAHGRPFSAEEFHREFPVAAERYAR